MAYFDYRSIVIFPHQLESVYKSGISSKSDSNFSDSDTNVNPWFKCDKCNIEVRNKDDLEAHTRTAHPLREPNRTDCNKCGHKANDKQDL